MLLFIWNSANIEHIGVHNVNPVEAEDVVRAARSPFPREIENDKNLVWGPTAEGRYLQVIFVFVEDDEIDFDNITAAQLATLIEEDAELVKVIHARDMTDREKKQLRALRRKKGQR